MTDSETEPLELFERRIAMYISRNGPIPLSEVARQVGRTELDCARQISSSSRLRLRDDFIVCSVVPAAFTTGSFVMPGVNAGPATSAAGGIAGGDDAYRPDNDPATVLKSGQKKHRRLQKQSAQAGAELDDGGQGKVGYLCIADEFNLDEIKLFYAKQGFHAKVAYDVLHVKPVGSASAGSAGSLPMGGSAGATAGGGGGGVGSSALGGGGGVSSYGATGARSDALGGISSFQMFVFKYGVVVWWGYDQRQYLMVDQDFVLPTSKIGKWFVNRYKGTIITANFPVWCKFSADWRESTLAHTTEPDALFAQKMEYDHFYIPADREDVKLCISHALAQSAKIDYLEIKIQELTHSCKPLPRELKETGSVTISERKLLQLRGEVLFYRLMLKSGSDLLDEPELFWQHPWLKPFYTTTKEFFSISARVETLDAKLDAANQILSMISDQFSQRHGSRLEWIVIWLVMVEVIIGILELILDIKPWVRSPFVQGATAVAHQAHGLLVAPGSGK